MKKLILSILAIAFLSSCAVGIHGAVSNQHMERVKSYVAEGQVNRRDTVYDNTPLITACYYGYADIAEYLCDNGADLNAQAINGSTALIYTAMNSYPDITQILIDHGADLNLKDKKGHTALYYAEKYRFFRVAEILKKGGARSE